MGLVVGRSMMMLAKTRQLIFLFWLCLLLPIHAQEEQVCREGDATCGGDCQDLHPSCQEWASSGECILNPGYMRHACSKSCWLCVGDNPGVVPYVTNDWGVTQEFAEDDADLKQSLRGMERYAKSFVDKSLDIPEDCKNSHEKCAFWALRGECQANPSYMMTHCGLACRTCQYLQVYLSYRQNRVDNDLPERPTPVMMHSSEEWKRIILEYEASVVKNMIEGQQDSENNEWVIQIHDPDGPLSRHGRRLYEWIVALPEDKWEPSKPYDDPTSLDDDNDSDPPTRTSSSIVCDRHCYTKQYPSIFVFLDLIRTQILKITDPYNTIDDKLQFVVELVRYAPKQRFGVHHDVLMTDSWYYGGQKTLTMFFYLNVPDDGSSGAMGFPEWDWSVIPPKQFSLLIWPNRDQNTAKLQRMVSEQLPPVKDTLYGIYIWLVEKDE